MMWVLTVSAIGQVPPMPPMPHLSQAWTAMSTGDGEPGLIGFEAYLYEPECKQINKTGCDEKALQGHVWDYGPACKKIEVKYNHEDSAYPKDARWSGTFYIKCDLLDCCWDGESEVRPTPPDVKQWDIDPPGKFDNTTYLGKHNTTELYDNPVIDADVWRNVDLIPGTEHRLAIRYDYFITKPGRDVITHRIHYDGADVPPGDILYGNFTVIQPPEIIAFREMFKPPAACGPDIPGPRLCDPPKVKEWNRKYFKHAAARAG